MKHFHMKRAETVNVNTYQLLEDDMPQKCAYIMKSAFSQHTNT